MVFPSHVRTPVRPLAPPPSEVQVHATALPPPPPAGTVEPAQMDPVQASSDQAPVVLTMRRTVPGFALLDAHGQMVSAKGLPVPLNHVHSAVDAFGAEHTSDLHFVLYVARSRASGRVEQRIPRITKPALPFLAYAGRLSVPAEVKRQLADIEVCGTALAVDFDLPNHARWDDSKLNDARELFASLQQKSKLIAAPTVFYTTAKGLRLVWLLTHAIPIEGPRGLHDLLGGLVVTCHMLGLHVDASCSDWTRIFRLPRVMREDEDQFGNTVYSRTAAQQYLKQSWGRVDFSADQAGPAAGLVALHSPDAFRGLSEITYEDASKYHAAQTLVDKWKNKFGRAPVSSTAAMEDVLVGVCPNDAEVQRLLHGAEGGGKDTPQVRSVKSWVDTRAAPKGKDAKPLASAVEAAEYLYYGRSFITDTSASGQLHSGILRLSCALGYVLRERLGEDDVTPQLLFAMVLQVARRSNAQRPVEMQREDSVLSGEVWSAVEWAYRQFRSQVIMDEREEQEVKESCEISARNSLAASEGFRKAIVAALIRSIDRGGGGTPPPPADYDWVAAQWDKCLVVEVPDAGISVASVTRDGRIYYSPLALTQGALHTYIRDSGHNAVTPTKPGVAPGSPEVLKSEAQLLKEYGSVASGGLRASRLIDWNELRMVAEPRGLVPVMIERVPGIRRDLTPKENPLVAEWLSLFAGPEQTDKLLDWLWAFPKIERASCGLYVEGDPGLGKGMLANALAHVTESRMFAPFEEVADQFQDTLIKTPFVWLDEHQSKNGSGHRSVMHTFKKLVTGEFRNINLKGKPKREIEGYWRVLITANTGSALPVEDDMNDQDIAALTVRLMYLHAQKAAGEFLTRIGGHEGTAGWVEREIPQHIMWLAANREVTRGSRLLVEGLPGEFHDNLTINRPSTDMTLRTLAVVAADLQRYQEVATIKGDRLWVSSNELFSTFNTLYGATRVNQLAPKAIEASLKMLSGNHSSKNFRVSSPGNKGRVHRRWDIPLASLLKRFKNAGESVDFRKSFGEAVWRDAARGVLTVDEINEICAPMAPPPPAQSLLTTRSVPSGLVSASMGTSNLFSSPNGQARPS